VTEPALTAVAMPELFIVATDVLLLVHTPPDPGESVVVFPTHTDVGPVTLADGLDSTVKGDETLEIHPVFVDVKVNVTDPGAIAVTMPDAFICAIAGLLLVQYPLVDAVSVVLEPTHILVVPV